MKTTHYSLWSLFLLLAYSTLFSQAQEIQNDPLVGFIENKGQISNGLNEPSDYVLFYTQSEEKNIYITTKGLSYVFFSETEEKEKYHWSRMDLFLEGAKILEKNIYREKASNQGYFN